MTQKKEIISVIGAGGKTTYIFREKDRYIKEGKRVLVTTTTHMLLPSGGCPRTAAAIGAGIEKNGWAIGGRPVLHKGVWKMEGLEDSVFMETAALADVVLIEADGARGKSFKAPKPWEPVIKSETTRIVLIAGLAATRGPIRETCYNYEDICRVLGKESTAVISREDMQKVIDLTYVKKLRDEGIFVPVEVIFTGTGIRG